MGVTYIKGVVASPTGKQATVRFLVDSGATYTLLPHKDWKAIGLSPKRGEPGDEPLLGVVTLEILGLVLNPFTRTLQPMRMLLV